MAVKTLSAVGGVSVMLGSGQVGLVSSIWSASGWQIQICLAADSEG
jgi:hypothetical protein